MTGTETAVGDISVEGFCTWLIVSEAARLVLKDYMAGDGTSWKAIQQAQEVLTATMAHISARFLIGSIDEIRQFLYDNSAIISGSYVLLAFHGAIFEPGDLDIYAPINRQVDINAYLKGKSYERLEGPSTYAAKNPSIERTVRYS